MTKQKPTPLSGFPELLPQEQMIYQKILDMIKKEYERCGFAQIETPAVERRSTLVSKGGSEKEIYALSRLAAEADENTDTDLALHFDLTVPLARYVAVHENELAFPFRRYQIQKVWRGERAQSGRYREFHQCDIDVIGRGELSTIVDAEIPSVIYNIFRKLDVGPFMIHINNRKLLQGYFEYMGIQQDDALAVMRIIDKIEKIGNEGVIDELQEEGISQENAHQIINFIGRKGSINEILAFLHKQEMGEEFERGCHELEGVVKDMRNFGVSDENFCLDLTIARGLDYYTGTVYETTLQDHPELGSVCSGGRYDDLASQFSEEKFPGVGISIGLTRLVIPLLRSGDIHVAAATPAKVLVTMMDALYQERYIKIASRLREAGINTELYLAPKKFRDQMTYANKKGFPLVIIAGEDEIEKGVVQIKDMHSGESQEVNEQDIIVTIKKIIE